MVLPIYKVTPWSAVHTEGFIKLLEHAVKVVEMVFEHRIRQQTADRNR